MTQNSKFLSTLIILNIAASASAEASLNQIGSKVVTEGINSQSSTTSTKVAITKDSFWIKALNVTKSGINTTLETASTKLSEGSDLVVANKNKAIVVAAVVVVAATAYTCYKLKKNKASRSDDNA